MTTTEPETPRDAPQNLSEQDSSSLLWKRYQEQRQKSTRILTTGLGLFAAFVVFLLAVGLWIVVVR
ncbi:MAG: hypothetical protein FJY29_03615 [Betaproteobacteria bacterium]|nr:hypothetical protein [Betaproteobacteria bacterium]